ncbi:hypothetical protein THOM_2223 [Trachipleistophora hominis]|uniref:Uncharacterized protein n=1 Tax=Trachipleistophora hominis TaxID=72359 RepID=L7JUX2_TRAHO|nr:hypothetical protein THOM_2223 [Trachipleistophora hominis]
MQLTPHAYLEEYRRAFVHNYEVLRGMVDELGSADSTSKRWVDLRRYVDVFDGHEIVFSNDGRYDNDNYDRPVNDNYDRHDRSIDDRHDNNRSINDRYINTHTNAHTDTNPIINPINHNFVPPYNYDTPHTIPSNTQPTIFNHSNHQTTNSPSDESKDTPKYAFGNIPYF